MHSLEVAHLSAMMASELGADVNVARTAGLLHDIGKAVDHEVEGPHALIGADIAKRLGRSPKIVHAIAAHHGEEEPTTVEAILVQAADAISGARPGRPARDAGELRQAAGGPGGRRQLLRGRGEVLRHPGRPRGAHHRQARGRSTTWPPRGWPATSASKIEESLEYPGQIKVTVIRETRAVDYAK